MSGGLAAVGGAGSDPVGSMRPEESGEAAELGQAITDFVAAKVVGQAAPVDLLGSSEAVEPAESVELAEAAAPADAVELAEAVELVRPAAAVEPSRSGILGAEGRAALSVWGASRLGMIVLAWIAAWVFSTGPEPPGPWLARWDRWDAGIFVSIARDGYFGPGVEPTHIAFFPGFPVAMWFVHLLVWNWTAAGLLVSFAAGTVAVVALGKLAADESDEAPSQASAHAALFFALAPAAVFLTAGYSESLFAAFAFPAWLAARRDRWVLSVLLAAGASAVRVNGLFLAAAIAVEFLLAGAERRRWRQLPLVLVPVLPAFGYALYLHRNTGDWLAWQHAQAAGWFRTFKDPKSAWDQTWRAAFGQSQEGHTAWVFQLELLAVVVGAVLTLVLVARRRLPEALYVGLSLVALGTTTWFMSVPRAMLLWWPLWTMLGAWAVRRPAVKTLYVCCVAPIMVGVALLFLSGQWAG